jgi:hypothetical protein
LEGGFESLLTVDRSVVPSVKKVLFLEMKKLPKEHSIHPATSQLHGVPVVNVPLSQKLTSGYVLWKLKIKIKFVQAFKMHFCEVLCFMSYPVNRKSYCEVKLMEHD